jgi:shikimate dehydrogenase
MKRYGLIGYPLTHSFSKSFFEKKFDQENLSDARFDLFPMNDINEFSGLIQSTEGLKGFAVTIPHKKNILPLLNELDETAREIGAVNCVRVRNGHTKGFNTDVMGFEQTLKTTRADCHKHALVLGSGGASACVQYVLKKHGIAFQLVGRSKNNDVIDLLYDELTEWHIRQHTLIVNTTPLGMSPNEETCPLIPYAYLNEHHTLIDLVYNPSETIFMKKGREKGALVENGYEMFRVQAEENWRIWNS